MLRVVLKKYKNISLNSTSNELNSIKILLSDKEGTRFEYHKSNLIETLFESYNKA